MCHTNKVSSSTGVRVVCFVPAGTEAAFMISTFLDLLAFLRPIARVLRVS